ncbi:unnamed protein product, partial [Allacma fusca]
SFYKNGKCNGWANIAKEYYCPSPYRFSV